MLTGTPLDLTPFGALLTGIGWLYWLLAAGGLWWALQGARPWKVKLLRALPIVLLFAFFPGLSAWQGLQQKLKLDAAMALFQERCKTAKETITRTVENVDGVVWMKWRESPQNLSDQFKLDDPYGRNCNAEECIAHLLRVTAGAERNPEVATRHSTGFRFVETVDPRDGRSYRYTASVRQGWGQEAIDRHKQKTGGDPPVHSFQFKIERVPVDRFTSRYGITWEDVSTRQDRERWIAGGSLKVVDLQANEVIGERKGFMIDRGQGSREGFRSPWAYAVQNACPEFPTELNSNRHDRTHRETRDFALRVLKANQGE